MERRGPPRVLVSDVSMPGMSGIELVRTVLDRWPETAVVLVTGRTDLVVDELEPNPLVVSVIEKPWQGPRFLSVLQRAREMARRRRGEDITTDLSECPQGILLVDADPDFVEAVRAACPTRGPLQVADRLSHAIDMLRYTQFDLILSELNLADARGIDAAERLRDVAPGIPLVLATSLEDETLATQLLQLGAEDVIQKDGSTPESLSRSLRFAIDRHAARSRRAELEQRDVLTGLASREILERRLTALSDAGQTYGVLFVDVDRFRDVNERLGLEAGDVLLRELAERFSEAIGPEDLLARRGGDEFVVIVNEEERARSVVHGMLERARRPVWVHGQPLSVTVSIGLAVAQGRKRRPGEVMAAADRALYEQKRRGRDGWTIGAPLRQPMKLGPSIREALTREELHLLYQPLWCLETSALHGFEALLRWSPRRGPSIPPVQFIAELEAEGGMIEVGAWVLNQALARGAEGMAEGARLSVNVSPRQLQGDEIIETVERALARHAVPPERLQLEITETVLLPDAPEVARRLKALHSMGVHIALDDFGVGYSSLGHLQRHPIDTVKIDRSLVSAAETDERARLIVASIAALGDKLEMTVVAEGVEWAHQLQMLREAGCDVAQGYLLGRPAAEWTPELLNEARRTLLSQ